MKDNLRTLVLPLMQLSSLSTINILTYDKLFIPCHTFEYLSVAEAVSEGLPLNPNGRETLGIMNFKDGLKVLFLSYFSVMFLLVL